MAKLQDCTRAALNRLTEKTKHNELVLDRRRVILKSEMTALTYGAQPQLEKMIIGIGDADCQMTFYSTGSDEDHAGIYLHLCTFAGEGIEH